MSPGGAVTLDCDRFSWMDWVPIVAEGPTVKRPSAGGNRPVTAPNVSYLDALKFLKVSEL